MVSRAYERTSLIVTTNLPFDQWTELLGSQRLIRALLDRLTHRVHILEANGESYLLQEPKRRQAARKRRNEIDTRRGDTGPVSTSATLRLRQRLWLCGGHLENQSLTPVEQES